jgi:hypothetical protein
MYIKMNDGYLNVGFRAIFFYMGPWGHGAIGPSRQQPICYFAFLGKVLWMQYECEFFETF